MARPAKLTPELLIQAAEYVEHFSEEPFNDVIPMAEGMALHVGVARETLHAWSRGEVPEGCEHLGDQFSHIFDRMMGKQAKTIINGSLNNVYNSTISKLMLTKHGYSDKTQQELTGANGGELTVQIVKLSQ